MPPVNKRLRPNVPSPSSSVQHAPPGMRSVPTVARNAEDREDGWTSPTLDVEDEEVGHRSAQIDDSLQRLFISSVEKRIIREISQHSAGVHRELADVKSCLNDLKAQVDVLALRADSGSSGATQGSGKADTIHLPNFHYCFNSEVCQRVMSSVVFHYIASRCVQCANVCNAEEEVATDISACFSKCIPVQSSALLYAILFGKKANMAKAVLHSGPGLEYSKIRKLVVLSLLRNVQRNRFNQFSTDTSSTPTSPSAGHANGFAQFSVNPAANTALSCPDPDTNGVGGVSIPKPKWLGDDVVNSSHVEATRLRLETKKCEKVRPSPGKRSIEAEDSQAKGDAAVVCVERLYKKVTGYMHQGRERARNLFFEELGYILTKWELPSVPMLLTRPGMKWLQPSSSSNILRMDDVPLNHPGPDGKRSSTFRAFLNKCASLTLCVEHDVDVVLESSTAEQTGSDPTISKQTRKLRRVVNLVDLALRFLNAFSGGSLEETNESLLGTQENSIRAAYAVATGFHGLVHEYYEHSEVHCDAPPDMDTLRFHDLRMSDIYPTPSVRMKIMQTMVTDMSESDFHMYHVPLPASVATTSRAASAEGVGAMDGTQEAGVAEQCVEGLDFIMC